MYTKKTSYLAPYLYGALLFILALIPARLCYADNAADASAASAAHDEAAVYKLGPGDELRVIVYGENGLSGTYKIGTDGAIALPLIGKVSLGGLSLVQAEQKLTERFKAGFLKDPHISLEVSKYRQFYVLGEVKSPGSYDYVGDMSVLKAVAIAGGFTYRAKKDEVELIRMQGADKKTLKDYDVDLDVMPGDVILVQERFF